MRVTAILAIVLLHCGYHVAAMPEDEPIYYPGFLTVCWDACNNAELERQIMQNCDGEAYKLLRDSCEQCVKSNDGDIKGWDDTLKKTPDCL